MQSTDDITARISESYGTMSHNHRRIAAFILDHPDEVALSSMRQVAGRLEMDPSAFVRFAKKLSLSGYAELRDLYRNELMEARTGYVERARKLQRKGRIGKIASLVSDMQSSNEANLDHLFERNPPELLQDAADAMIRARHIYIIGMRSCFSPAFALHYACKMVRQNVHLGDGLAGTFADGMRGIGPKDVFLAIGTHHYSRDTVMAAGYAARCQARIIALTDSKLSPLAENAEFTLLFRPKGPLVLGTMVPAMAMAEALSAVLIARGGEKALSALTESERQLADFAAYAADGPTDRTAPHGPTGDAD